MQIRWVNISSDQESEALEIQFHNPYPPNSSFQKENAGMQAAFSCEFPPNNHPERKGGWLVYTCWSSNTRRTQAALSSLETTPWFGDRARWQVSAWVTAFLVPSVHSSLKSSCIRFLAQASGFFPGDREGGSATADGFGQDTLSGGYDRPIGVWRAWIQWPAEVHLSVRLQWRGEEES